MGLLEALLKRDPKGTHKHFWFQVPRSQVQLLPQKSGHRLHLCHSLPGKTQQSTKHLQWSQLSHPVQVWGFSPLPSPTLGVLSPRWDPCLLLGFTFPSQTLQGKGAVEWVKELKNQVPSSRRTQPPEPCEPWKLHFSKPVPAPCSC